MNQPKSLVVNDDHDITETIYKPFDMQELISKAKELLAREKERTHGQEKGTHS